MAIPPRPDRRGLPSPLIFHLGAAAAIMAQGLALAPLAGGARFPWPGPMAAPGRRLGPVDPAAVATEAMARLGAMLEGIERWQRHPHRRRLADPPALWSAGCSRLLDFGGAGPVVFVVPSLINRPHVLDLGPDRSLMRFLARRGLRPLLLDWGIPGPAEADFDLTAWCTRRMLPALAVAAGAGGGRIALLGYCMGGTLAVAAATLAPGAVARMALIGAPWCFAAGRGAMLAMRLLGRDAGPDRVAGLLRAIAATFGAIPHDLLQLIFALLDPGLALAKFRRFAAMDPAGMEARRFVELEDWLNDPVPLTGPAAVELLVDWQLRNVTGRGEWRIAGRPVRPAALRLPVLGFCARRDRIAPRDSTEPLLAAIPDARILRPAAGHVGMIVSGSARDALWEPLALFLAQGR